MLHSNGCPKGNLFQIKKISINMDPFAFETQDPFPSVKDTNDVLKLVALHFELIKEKKFQESVYPLYYLKENSGSVLEKTTACYYLSKFYLKHLKYPQRILKAQHYLEEAVWIIFKRFYLCRIKECLIAVKMEKFGFG